MDSKSNLNASEKILRLLENYRMFNFMCALLILLILTAVLEGYSYAHSLLSTFGMVVFAAGGYAACTSRRSLKILVTLAVPWLLCEWFFPSSMLVYLNFFFFFYLIVLLVRMVINSDEITSNTLYGAVCIYLLLGLMWATLYGFINEIFPGSIFSGMLPDAYHHHKEINEFIYFSYTTLTTLGYGDITSVTPVGRLIAVFEAMTGQLFLAFLVARLISVYSLKHINK
ncbi:MAG: potassium channel family protein [Candidatus Dadabacteria bacterium]|nr:potassium channel family protein [Candidatus Dadabacteria bacterium]